MKIREVGALHGNVSLSDAERRQRFEGIYAQTREAVYAYLAGMLSQAADCDEAFQDTFLKLYDRLGEVDPRTPRAYVMALARSQVRDRRRRVPPAAPLSSTPAAPEASTPDLGEDLRAALASLRPEQREVFLLRHEGGLTYAELAKVLGIRRGTVASRLHLAMTELRRRLLPAQRPQEIDS